MAPPMSHGGSGTAVQAVRRVAQARRAGHLTLWSRLSRQLSRADSALGLRAGFAVVGLEEPSSRIGVAWGGQPVSDA